MKKRPKPGLKQNIEDLYLRLLQAFYEDEDRDEAHKVGKLLEVELASRPDFAESIRGDEVRSLLAELSGDLASATQWRESEIRKIFELHILAQGTAGWASVQKQYDYSDIGDRLDLLANLYAQTGNYRRALDVLEESKNFCASHQIPFDGADLLEEFTTQIQKSSVNPEENRVDQRLLDVAIIETYKTLNTSVEQILIDDQKSRRFHEEVSRRLPEGMEVSAISAKKRLVNLRRRGQDRGGLPRLSRRA
jgi:hypothetical protein